MKLSEQFDKLLPALHRARSQFVKVKKDKQNSHLKNKYATLDSVLDAITPALTDNELMVMQDMIQHEDIPDPSSKFKRTLMRVETTIMHVSGQWAKFYSEIPIVKDDPQGVGSAFTYARRYALAAAFGLSQADDDAQIAVKSAQDWKKDIEKAETTEELQDVFAKAYKTSDHASRVIIKDHYNQRKAEIEMAGSRGFSPVE